MVLIVRKSKGEKERIVFFFFRRKFIKYYATKLFYKLRSYEVFSIEGDGY